MSLWWRAGSTVGTADSGSRPDLQAGASAPRSVSAGGYRPPERALSSRIRSRKPPVYAGTVETNSEVKDAQWNEKPIRRDRLTSTLAAAVAGRTAAEPAASLRAPASCTSIPARQRPPVVDYSAGLPVRVPERKSRSGRKMVLLKAAEPKMTACEPLPVSSRRGGESDEGPKARGAACASVGLRVGSRAPCRSRHPKSFCRHRVCPYRNRLPGIGVA